VAGAAFAATALCHEIGGIFMPAIPSRECSGIQESKGKEARVFRRRVSSSRYPRRTPSMQVRFEGTVFASSH
jgi:hypothetical protein